MKGKQQHPMPAAFQLAWLDFARVMAEADAQTPELNCPLRAARQSLTEEIPLAAGYHKCRDGPIRTFKLRRGLRLEKAVKGKG